MLILRALMDNCGFKIESPLVPRWQYMSNVAYDLLVAALVWLIGEILYRRFRWYLRERKSHKDKR